MMVSRRMGRPTDDAYTFILSLMVRVGQLILMGFTLGLIWGAPVAAETAAIAPLAQRSLLLDGAALEGGRLIAVGERGHILYSDDQGDSWRQVAAPTRATLTAVCFHDGKKGWIVGHDAVILHTYDGGNSWEKVYAAPEEERPLLDMWSRDGRTGFAIGAYGYFLETEDWGKTWRMGAISEEDWHLNQVSLSETGKLYIAAEGGMVYRSDDQGRTWQSLPSPYEGSFFGTLPLAGDTVLLFGLRGNLFRSEDAGETWSNIETGTEAMLNTGVRLSDGRVVVAGLAGTLLVSRDDGRRFTLVQQPDRMGISGVIPIGDTHLMLIGEGGVKKIPVDF